MNMFKKNGGFTLVELIVVIAILAILAGIAIPAYSGYIARANETKDINSLEAVQVAAMSAGSLNGETSNEVEITTDADGDIIGVKVGNTVLVAASGENEKAAEDFDEFIGTLPKLVLEENWNKVITEGTEGWEAAAPTP